MATSLLALLVEWQLERWDRRALHSDWVRLGDGTRLRVLRQGAQRAGPTVVFISGLSATLESWQLVQRELSQSLPTFAYDRAGTGFSDSVTGPRDAQAIASELEQVLTAAQIRLPYLLVAHSIAGLYARVYAHEHPEKVAGIVLVDPLTEDEWARVSAASSRADHNYLFQHVRRKAILGYLGILRLRAWIGSGEIVDPRIARDDDSVADRSAAEWRGDHWRTAAREANAVFASFDAARAAPFPPRAAVGILSAGLPLTSDIAIVQGLHRELANSAAGAGLHEIDLQADHSALLGLAGPAQHVSAFIKKVLQSAGDTPRMAH